MIKCYPISKLIRYSSIFRVYADIYHTGRRICGRKEKEQKVLSKSASSIDSLVELLSYADEHSASVYGKDLIQRYAEDPGSTILLVSHELSLSGAPFALLNLALVLKKYGWQTVIVSPEDGDIGTYAADRGIPSIYIPDLYCAGFISGTKDLFAIVIANTIVSSPVVKELDGTDTPVLWWIHEASEVYSRDMAEELPRNLSENVHIYCAGKYAQKMLACRFPRYDTDVLLYYANDVSCCAGDASPSILKKTGDSKVFACVGLIEHRKGQDILLEAIDMLPDKVGRKSRYTFVGKVRDNEIKEQLEMMQKKYPDRIVFHEGLGHDELLELYRETDFLICPSRDDPMPVVAAEAMSLGKPCICSGNTGTAEIIERYDAGFTYADNDPEKLSELIGCACRLSDAGYHRFAGNARRTYEEVFSEEVFEKNLDDIMMKMTGAKLERDNIGKK